MHRYQLIVAATVVAFVLSGCLGQSSDGDEGISSEFEREIDAGLDGIEYRLRALETEDYSQDGVEETLIELRRNRDELRRQLDRLADRGASSDSIETELRRQLNDLAVRYETARLGRFESRALFEEAVEIRFEDLDRELALLEGQVFQDELRDRFDPMIARLYSVRNEVALLVAETAAAPDQRFPQLRSELAAAIVNLDLLLANATIAVDRALEEKYPVQSLNKLWL